VRKKCKRCGEIIFNRKKNAVYCKECSSTINVPGWIKEFQKEVDRIGYIKALLKLDKIKQDIKEGKNEQMDNIWY